MTYMSYHLRLELSFLMDEFAMPPPPPGEHTFGIADTDDTKPCPCHSADNDDGGVKTASEDTSEGHIAVTEERNVGAWILRSGDGNAVDANSTICVGSEAAELTDRSGEKSPNDAGSEKTCVGSEAVDSTEQSCDKSPNDNENSTSVSDPTMVEHVSDFSDPLHDYQRSRDESIFDSHSELRVVGRTSQHFKTALDDVALSVSPFIEHNLPYLLTDSGAKCRLRSFFPEHIFCSELLQSTADTTFEKCKVAVAVTMPAGVKDDRDVVLGKEHEFITQKLTDSADDCHIQVRMLSSHVGRCTLPREHSNRL